MSMFQSVPALRPSLVAVAAALALVAPALHAQGTFEGTIVNDGALLAADGPASNVFGQAMTTGFVFSRFEGHVSDGLSRVASSSNGRDGIGQVTTTLTYRELVTAPFAGNAAFPFFIPGSRVAMLVEPGNDSLVRSFSANTTFSAQIAWGGQTLWSVSFGIEASGNVENQTLSVVKVGPTATPSAAGFVVGGLDNGIDFEYDGPPYAIRGYAQLSSDPYEGLLALGELQAGEQKELVYTLTAVSSYVDDSNGASYGYGGYAAAGGFDPFGIEFTPNPAGDGVLIVPSPIPEPSTYALMLAGIAGVSLLARRRRPQR
jgi:hypothetical protein